MSKINKPLLAEDYVEESLQFPYFASVKLDGFRAFNQNAALLTRSGKRIANDFTSSRFSAAAFEGLDGELIVGPWNKAESTFKTTSSAMKKKGGEPAAVWYCFDDRTKIDLGFHGRLDSVRERVQHLRDSGFHHIGFLEHTYIRDLKDMLAFEQWALTSGFEGIMLRDPAGRYKYGRSTVNENILLKVKRYKSEEAKIIGYKERMENLNEAFLDELGRTKRSEAKDGLVGTGMVGSFEVQSDLWPTPFYISASSLTHEEAKEAFQNFGSMYEGELARFKYFPYGVVDVPRHGVFEGLRAREDL